MRRVMWAAVVTVLLVMLCGCGSTGRKALLGSEWPNGWEAGGQQGQQGVEQTDQVEQKHTVAPTDESETDTEAKAGRDVRVDTSSETNTNIREEVTSLKKSVQKLAQNQQASTQTLRNDVESLEELTQNVQSTVKNYGLSPERLEYYRDSLDRAYAIAAVMVLVVVGGAFFLLYLPAPQGVIGGWVTLSVAVVFLAAGVYVGVYSFILGG